jgi:hypothetical protein
VTLEEVYYISQIVAVVAIIGSLVAIYFQQSQTNKIARAQISQGVSVNYQGTLREVMDPELAAIFRKVMFEHAPLTPLESTQILIYFNLTLGPVRDAFHVVRDGLVDARLLEDLSQNVCWYLTAPVFEAEWRRVQRTGIYGHDFVAYVNSRFKKLHPNHDASRLTPGAHEDQSVISVQRPAT